MNNYKIYFFPNDQDENMAFLKDESIENAMENALSLWKKIYNDEFVGKLLIKYLGEDFSMLETEKIVDRNTEEKNNYNSSINSFIAGNLCVRLVETLHNKNFIKNNRYRFEIEFTLEDIPIKPNVMPGLTIKIKKSNLLEIKENNNADSCTDGQG
jgi:hypothetical protein